MKTKQTVIALTTGIAIGMSAATPAALAALTAAPSTQKFYVNGQQVQLEAYAIDGHNYVQLRDIGRAVDFGVDYDAATNSVRITPDGHYQEEAPAGTVRLPNDGSQYIPQVGDVIRCQDGTDYTITDVRRWDASAFAEGPLGDLPTPTCDWSLLSQPELPAPEARHFTIAGKQEYLFVRNLYETRRMQYTLYNATGNDPRTWQDGKPILRKDGSQFVRIHLSIPADVESYAFWPWRERDLLNLFTSCPSGDYYIEAWDVYKDGAFFRTEYNILKTGAPI